MNKRTFTPATTDATPRGRVDVAKTNPRLAKGRISTYLKRDTLTIPDEIRERFEDSGYHLRWVRCNFGVGGQFDIKNVGNRAMMGYIPVIAEEIPEFAYFVTRRDIGLPGAPGEYDYKDVITQGDLMLAKCPIENVAAYRREVAEESRLRQQAVSREAKQKGLHIDESETTFTQNGRRFIQRDVGFADD